jgi:hypothetical protein
MKRIISGATYNTDTSTPVGRYSYEDDVDGADSTVYCEVYQTRGSAFFVVETWVDGNRSDRCNFVAVTRDEIAQIVASADNFEIIDFNAIPEPPEAVAEADACMTIYVRVPAAIKIRIEEAAKSANLSVSSWILRCVERCTDAKQG